MLTLSSGVLALVAIVLVAHSREHGPEIISMLRTAMDGLKTKKKNTKKGISTKSEELLDAAVWEIRIQQCIATSRVYIHLTAAALISLVCGMLLNPASICPWQIMLCLAGWSLHHLTVTQTLKLDKARLRIVVLIHHLQCGVFSSALPSDCEPWWQLVVFLG
eukprot:Skav209631  [mRNA]  locus=scaffold2751:25232:25997:+ [translate_table: standard]